MKKEIELFKRHAKNPILTAKKWPYLANAVFNPAAAMDGKDTVLLVRVEDRSGISHLTAARSSNGYTGWKIDKTPTFSSDPRRRPEEIYGVEDPRLTWLPERKEWAMTYTAVSDHETYVALAMTRDLKTFRRQGTILRPPDKDAALFPRRFGNRWAILHRPIVDPRQDAHIWLSFSPDLKHWGGSHPLIKARSGTWWDSGKIGLCPQPLETPEGWLVMYHGVRRHCSGSIYRVGFALLDLERPWKVIRRSRDWVMTPSAPYEMSGDVGQVVFPCGWVHDQAKKEVRVYYGGADTCVAVASVPMRRLLAYIKSLPS
ncbi:MAG: glycosidase [Elusimicrobiota bacterium]